MDRDTEFGSPGTPSSALLIYLLALLRELADGPGFEISVELCRCT
jgi:hypothetical protein